MLAGLASLLAAAFAAVSPGIARLSAPARALPLAGAVIGIDPGHNGRNGEDPAWLNHLVWNGREEEGCDTTGAATATGYTEAAFNWSVAVHLARDLRSAGARVVLTRHSNDGRGPCVDRRAEILDHARVDVAIDIHADGGPVAGRGFAILEPIADGPNNQVIRASERFGHILSADFRRTGMPVSTYDGIDGIAFRDDLAGLNLTTVPKVLIECGNMANPTDARLLSSARWQRGAARAMAEAIAGYLHRRD